MACQLLFLDGERAGTLVSVETTPYLLGRDPRCQLTFDPEGDLTVSGRHAQLVRAAEGYEIRDTSTNGTFVNGERVERSMALADGDVLELGPGGPRLRFSRLVTGMQSALPHTFLGPAGSEEAPTVARDSLLAGSLPRSAPVLPAGSALTGPALSVGPRVRVLVPTAPLPAGQAKDSGELSSGRDTLTRLELVLERVPSGERLTFSQPVVRLGRDPAADVPFDPRRDLLVSYSHAKVLALEGRAVLFDSESTNGTYIHGQRVTRQDLVGGEEIELGQGGPLLRVVSVGLAGPRAGAAAADHLARDGATVFGAEAPDLAGLSLGQAELLGEYPLASRLTLGRGEQNDVVLDSMYVSSLHAVLEPRPGRGPLLRDMGSANGTYLDGQRVSEAELSPGAELCLGPYVLKYSGSALLVFDTRTRTWVEARGLSRFDAGGKTAYLDRVSLKVRPGEFLCILGPSGCGKSTLLRCLNGFDRADEGRVLLNNIDFYAHHEQLKHQVGYLPQDDIVHASLTAWRTLVHAARLRLPPGTSPARRRERIEDVLGMLELYDHRHKPIHRLSGGQRKRVSIAVELLTDPAILYLDEPTSGLDPNLEEKMMLLLREMTLRGKTVVAVTHTLDNIHLADKVLFLVEGKLAFLGTPQEALAHFDVERLPEVYRRFDERRGDPDALRVQFEASAAHARHIGPPQAGPEGALARETPAAPRASGNRPGPLRQLAALTIRYLEIISRDARNSAILLLQAPLVALFIVLALGSDQPDRGPTSTMFLVMSLSALWFGCSNAAREISKEGAVLARERMVGLGVVPYVMSKVLVLQLLSLLQVATMLLMVNALRDGYTLASPPPACTRWGISACSMLILQGVPGDLGAHLLNLYLTALNGIGLGLLVSALAGNSDKAMSLVPLVLIPQVLFSGSFGVPPPDAHVKRALGYAVTLSWSLDQAKRIAMCSADEEKPSGRPGEGCVRCLHAHDPFKHLRLGVEPQDDDGRCLSVLPVTGQMTEFPEALEVVEDGLYTPPGVHGKGRARDATRSPIGLLVQGGYALLIFTLVCVFLRRRLRRR